MIRRALLLLVLAVAPLAVASPAAAAVCPPGFGSNVDAPTPERPDQGLAALVTQRPDPLPPADADPFAADSPHSVYEVYGTAGMRWATYDLGCGGELGDPVAAAMTTLANTAAMVTQFGLGVATTVMTAALEPEAWVGVFDPLIADATSAFQDGFLTVWLPVTLGVLGLILVADARGRSLSKTAGAVCSAVVVLVAATLILQWPTTAPKMADAAITGTVGAVADGITGATPGVGGGDPGLQVAAAMYEPLVWDKKLAGWLGTSDSPTAREYGPALQQATAYTWREAAVLDADPDAGQEITERKAELFEETAEAVCEADPAACEHLRGERGESRIGQALMAAVAVACAAPFIFPAALLMVVGFLLLRFLLVLVPVVAVFAVVPQLRGLAVGVANTALATVVNTAVLGSMVPLNALAVGTITSSDLGIHPILQVVLAGTVAVVFALMAWFMAKQFRRLTKTPGAGGALQDGIEGPAKAGRKAAGYAGQAALAATGHLAGAVAASRLTDDDGPDRPDPRWTERGAAPYRHRYEAEAAPEPGPPLPLPAGPAGAAQSHAHAAADTRGLPAGSQPRTEPPGAPGSAPEWRLFPPGAQTEAEKAGYTVHQAVPHPAEPGVWDITPGEADGPDSWVCPEHLTGYNPACPTCTSAYA